MNDSNIVPFVFQHQEEQTPIRAMTINGKPWFVGVDVCSALGLTVNGTVFRRLKDHEKGSYQIATLGGPQQMTIINREGLTRLVMRSDKPQAEAFQDWIVEDVIPSICDTGKYELAQQPAIGGRELLDAINSVKASVDDGFAALKEDPPFSVATIRYVCEGVLKYEKGKCIYCQKNVVVDVKTRQPIKGQSHKHHADFNHKNFAKDNLVIVCPECHKNLHYTDRPNHIPYEMAVHVAKGFHHKLRIVARQIRPLTKQPTFWNFATQDDWITAATSLQNEPKKKKA